MVSVREDQATLDDLYKIDGKAELIAGRIVPLMASGHKPNRVAGRIFRSLADYSDEDGRGQAYTDNAGFAVAELRSGRQSFSPDAAWYDGALPENRMRFIPGPPNFAAEVRSEGDYSPTAESAMAEKRADYFEAGTEVVWDVDPVGEWIDVYRRTNPEHAQRFERGDVADAEPAVPGWRVEVEWLFH